jgi:hypothetical protein
MSTINQLNSADQVSGSDLLAIYSQANGASRKISFTNFLAWLDDQAIATQDNKVTQYAAPLTGATLQVTDSQNSIWLILTPAGTLATLTLKMPLSTSVLDKTEVLVNSTQILTALSFDANGGTIVGAPTTLAANGFFTLRFDTVMQTWYRVN